jgi:TetR/AcrR family transcriptional repressor of lmrAB and yxaGH operons
MKEKTNTREQIVETALCLFFSQGYHATGLNQIVKESEAPKGSLYYYFPRGKEELALACIELNKRHVSERLQHNFANAADFVTGMQSFMLEAAEDICRKDFQGIASSSFWTAVETSCISDQLREACQNTFAEWKAVIVGELSKEGWKAERAGEIGTCMISMLEGSFILALTNKSKEPLVTASRCIPLLAEGKSNLS